MKHLSFLKVPKPIRLRCYVTFIECVFICRLCTVYGHIMSNSYEKSIDNVTSTAGYLAGCRFSDVSDIYERCFHNKCLRMYATENEPLFELDKLPSGRYRALKCRVDIRKNCYRAQCIKFLIKTYF